MDEEYRPTISERLIIGMLCDICDHLKVDGYNTTLLREVIGVHPWALKWEYPFEGPVPEGVAKEVADILELWNWIEISYERLSEADRSELGDYSSFRGFDGNMESEHYSVADILINKMGRWRRFQERDLNSHIPMITHYQRMLESFPRHELAAVAVRGGFSKEELREVLNVLVA